METYILAEDVMANIKAYRRSLDYDDQFDFEIETRRLILSDKSRAKLKNTISSVEHRKLRYGIHKDKK